MLALRGRASCRAWAAVAVAFCFSAWFGAVTSVSFSANFLNSNAIKNQPSGGAVQAAGSSPNGAAPGNPALHDGSNKRPAGDSQQLAFCAEDEDCNADEFCSAPARGGVSGGGGLVCLTCRRRRKRCFRDAMCCLGSFCNNGMCADTDRFHPGKIEEIIIENFDHGTLDTHLKRTTTSSQLYHLKGQEGAVCLRSSDCAEGLCCARHFWSKICKPVLKEGQVCTKHHKKGAHGLELFQRCYCGDGLICRLQRDHTISNSSRLHTCQRH
ncbi:dickkopf-related protein 1 [Candoia aspera]|uniref:dickkopf-related protein 1 n=1 Tax=Candoia aspera TaxID=51853 RepID=UPI002FD80300